MPDEHCRKCGNSQTTFALCAKCRRDIQKICNVCGKKTLEQFHTGCFLELEWVQTTVSLDDATINI